MFFFRVEQKLSGKRVKGSMAGCTFTQEWTRKKRREFFLRQLCFTQPPTVAPKSTLPSERAGRWHPNANPNVARHTPCWATKDRAEGRNRTISTRWPLGSMLLKHAGEQYGTFSSIFLLLKFLINLSSCYNKLPFSNTITIWIGISFNWCAIIALLKAISFLVLRTLYVMYSRDRHEAQSCFGSLELLSWTSRNSYIESVTEMF